MSEALGSDRKHGGAEDEIFTQLISHIQSGGRIIILFSFKQSHRQIDIKVITLHEPVNQSHAVSHDPRPLCLCKEGRVKLQNTQWGQHVRLKQPLLNKSSSRHNSASSQTSFASILNMEHSRALYYIHYILQTINTRRLEAQATASLQRREGAIHSGPWCTHLGRELRNLLT